jgi:hypothetical protein
VTIVDRSVDVDGESGLRTDFPRAEHRQSSPVAGPS